MGKRHPAEGDSRIGAAPHGLVQSVRSADHDGETPAAAVDMAAEKVGEGGTVQAVAALVENAEGRIGKGGQHGTGFVSHALRRVPGAGFGDFLDSDPGKPGFSAKAGAALQVPAQKFTLGPGLQAAYANQIEAHAGAVQAVRRSSGRSTPQSFSRL